MRATPAIEVGTGLFVLLGFAALFFLVTQITSRDIGFGDNTYRLNATFEQVGGLKVGAPVSMSGVTIGRVESIGYDFNEYKAVVRLRIDQRYDRIPDDSDASIFTAGLLGGQYVGIGPGGSETFFKDGDQIQFTQSAIVLESLISKFLFSKAGEQADAKASEGAK
jgi:phospholipid/cholesterol/gamma-HCH transport system substrate-binding protein